LHFEHLVNSESDLLQFWHVDGGSDCGLACDVDNDGFCDVLDSATFGDGSVSMTVRSIKLKSLWKMCPTGCGV